MKDPDANPFQFGLLLTLLFTVLITLILSGNGLTLWQFHVARLQSDRLAAVNQQLVEVLRLQASLLAFHERLDELAHSRDARRLLAEAEPLRNALLEETRQTRTDLAGLAPEARIDPAFLPTLEAIEVTLPSQLKAIDELASIGDWEAVQLRLANELKPMETQTSVLVRNIGQEVIDEQAQAVAGTKMLQRRILFIVPATAVSTVIIAAFFGWASARRIIELRLEERVGERMRITRELHDTLLQTILACKLIADDSLEETANHLPMRHSMEQLSRWLARAMEEGRTALNSLRASATEQNNLLESLRQALENCRFQNPIEGLFSVAGAIQEMHPVVRDEIYRIGYEAIRNACAHSQGSRLEVRIHYARNLTLRILDNGKGMTAAVAEEGKEGHFGLRSMRERAARIGAKFTIASSPDAGTEVCVVVPGHIVYKTRSRTHPAQLR